MSQVHGVIVVARNGDRMEYYQDPNTYNAEFTEATALGEVSERLQGRWFQYAHPAILHRPNRSNSALC
jgi:lysosomal acid phosphatase